MAGRWACGGRTVHGAEKGDSARLVQRPGGAARGRRQPAGGPGQSAGVRAARAGQAAAWAVREWSAGAGFLGCWCTRVGWVAVKRRWPGAGPSAVEGTDLCRLGQRRRWAGVERGKRRTGLGPGRGLGWWASGMGFGSGWVWDLLGFLLFLFLNFSILFLSSFLFLKQTITQLGEFKFKFEFTTSTQTNKIMLQHDATTNLNLL